MITYYKRTRLRRKTISIHDITLDDFNDELDTYKDLIYKCGYKVLFECYGEQTIILYN